VNDRFLLETKRIAEETIKKKTPVEVFVGTGTNLQSEIEKLVRLGYDREQAETMALALIEEQEAAETSSMSTGERAGGLFFGAFLICFGLPFVLIPFTIWSEVGEAGALDLLLICFPIPFIMAGGFVIFMGLNVLKMALTGEAGSAGSWVVEAGSMSTQPAERPILETGAYGSSDFPSMEDIVGESEVDLLPDFPGDAPVEETVDNDAGGFWGDINGKNEP